MNIDMITAQKRSLCALLPHNTSVETEVGMPKEKFFLFFFFFFGNREREREEFGLVGWAAGLFPIFWHYVSDGISSLKCLR